jgi:hypothetical protein
MSDDHDRKQAARWRYEQTPMPTDEIARGAGVSQRTIQRWAKRGGWKRFRQPVSALLAPTPPAVSAPPTAPGPATPMSPSAFAARVLHGLTPTIAQVQARVIEAAERSSIDIKEMRAVAEFCRAARQLALLAELRDPADDSDHGSDDADSLRRELSQRLARLAAEHAGALHPEPPDPAA